MSLIFAGIMPNSPLMTHETKGSATISAALQEFVGELYCMKPDTIVLLSEHGSEVDDLLNVNIYSPLHIGSRAVPVDVALSARIKEQSDLEQDRQLITPIAKEKVAPEIAAPLEVLFEHLPHTRVVVLHTSKKLTIEEHFSFGNFLRSILLATNERIALVTAGHLSHVQTEKQHAHSSFDTLCVSFLTSGQPKKILQINSSVQEESGTDIIKPLAIFLGTIHTMNTTPHLFLYEYCWNQGNSIVNFNFH